MHASIFMIFNIEDVSEGRPQRVWVEVLTHIWRRREEEEAERRNIQVETDKEERCREDRGRGGRRKKEMRASERQGESLKGKNNRGV